MSTVDAAKQRSGNLECFLEGVREDIVKHLIKTMPKEVIKWFCSNFSFNIQEGKRKHVMSIADFTRILRGRTLSGGEYFKASLLQSCITLLQASRVDTYLDAQPNRKQWLECICVGDTDIVIKDSVWLHGVIYYLLKKFFRAETYYTHLIELFHETAFRVEMSHLVNLITVPKDRVDLSNFSLQRHDLITRSNITDFYLPVALAMCICGIPESYSLHGRLFFPYTTARSILLQFGEYSRARDDFLNYISTVGEVENTRSDIAENKCSWCINVALVIASPEQRKVLEENYGQKELEKEMRVREVYELVGMREQYRVYEVSMKERIKGLIAEIPQPEVDGDGCTLKREMFTSFFDKICKGTK